MFIIYVSYSFFLDNKKRFQKKFIRECNFQKRMKSILFNLMIKNDNKIQFFQFQQTYFINEQIFIKIFVKTQQQSQNIKKMSNYSESKSKNRGPLIAVIKIQLDPQNSDRIFLHLKDDDQFLAQEFIQKHHLNPIFKRHIYGQIQQSRKAVDQQIIKFNREYSQSDSFTTPIRGRNQQIEKEEQQQYFYQNKNAERNQHLKNKLKQVEEHKSDSFFRKPQKSLNTNENSIHLKNSTLGYQMCNQNQSLNFITYSDSQAGSYQNQRRQKNEKAKLQPQYSIKQKKQIHVIQKSSHQENFQSQKQVFDAIAKSSKMIDSNSLYQRKTEKYKNLYDVSGLKLKGKSTYNDYKNQQIDFAQNKIQSQSSDKSQGLFQKKIASHKKEDQLNHFQSNSKDKTFAQRAQNIYEKKKDQQILYQAYKQEKNRQNVKQFYQEPQISNSYSRKRFDYSKDFKNQTKQQSKVREYSKTLFPISYNEMKSLGEINSGTNYISFSKPNYSVFDSNNSKGYKKTINQHENQAAENSLKKIGSIRSNNKLISENSQYLRKIPQHIQDDEINLQLEVTNKFYNQEKLFHDIKDIRNAKSTKQMKQNYQLNSEQTETNRPSRVKFYTKDDLKSLKNSTLSHSISRTQVSRINKQVTSRLYNQEDIKKKYINTLKSRAKNLKMEQQFEKEQLTHKPQINILSKILAEKRKVQNKTLEDHLLEQGKVLQIKKQQMINRQARKKLQECSFRPQINQQSYRLNAIQRSRSKTHLSSYSEMKCSKKTINEATFHPEINKLSNQLAKSKGNFEQRQHAYMEEKNSKLFKKLQQQRLKDKMDPNSGQRLFHPQITQRSNKLAKAISSQQRSSPKSIHNYLYELSKVHHPQPEFNPKPQINPQSQSIIQLLHQKRLNWLFSELDNDQDGIISSRRICIDRIPAQILQIIAPVLYQMEELNTELNIQDFKNAIQNLNKSIDPHQKSILYSYNYTAKAIRT